MLQRSEETVRELREITTKTDTRDILSHATIQAEALEDYFLVDIDAHVTETQFWPEILHLIDNDVIRHMGQAVASRPGTSTALLNSQPGTLYQHVYGRIPHQVALAEAVDALASSLEKLADGERGWIPLAQAALLFSTEDRQYAFGELDDAGKNRLAMFGADHRCTPDFRPTEGRVYFRKYG